MGEDELRVDSKQPVREFPAPALPYLPPKPRGPLPNIGLVGCGGISAYHLDAYRRAGFPVVALCNRTIEKAKERRDQYFPEAAVCTDYREVLARKDVGVVDLAVHPEIRAEMIEDALKAGKHVLSQKPFVLDLDAGERLAGLAAERGLKLAVNQNGRWAPHFSYIRQAVRAGLIGEVTAVHLAVHWDHRWTRGTAFDEMRHMILYDFGIHWFDMAACLMGTREPKSVFASAARAAGQENRAPMLAQALIEYEGAQVSIAFDAATPYGALDTTYVAGTRGSLVSEGPDLNHQRVTLYTEAGVARPALEGEWFENGFVGTMAELLCAVEEEREPDNDARENLRSLALCFAAMASADSGRPETPGRTRKVN